TGWVDIGLSPKGVKEAISGGQRIKNIPFDVIYVSTLMRAQMTAFLAMSEHTATKTPVIIHPENAKLASWGKIYSEETKKNCTPVISAWELNERYYGELQGMNKDAARKEYGKDQVKIWRRSFDTPPPNGESLEMTAKRVIPYFQENVMQHLEAQENVFISAHGNSLRAILMHLDQLSKEEVLHLEVPTGEPICYSYDQGHFTKEDVDECQKRYI
ncbi:MAG: 2,3-bisphosphoglycerate-dependent phosphoglycerate mutase, partial [Simkaniaceae bacterium]|nr:2,3-bisphosphoglycerate-dependent phosphoglycerate mutase [Simkaniaceae bacterium]